MGGHDPHFLWFLDFFTSSQLSSLHVFKAFDFRFSSVYFSFFLRSSVETAQHCPSLFVEGCSASKGRGSAQWASWNETIPVVWRFEVMKAFEAFWNVLKRLLSTCFDMFWHVWKLFDEVLLREGSWKALRSLDGVPESRNTWDWAKGQRQIHLFVTMQTGLQRCNFSFIRFSGLFLCSSNLVVKKPEGPEGDLFILSVRWRPWSFAPAAWSRRRSSLAVPFFFLLFVRAMARKLFS